MTRIADEAIPTPSIRMVGARRMQCKDIPDDAFLEAVRRAGVPGRWRMRWEVQAELETALGPLPENLFLAKARKLIAARKLGGCGCGCRGDYELPDESELDPAYDPPGLTAAKIAEQLAKLGEGTAGLGLVRSIFDDAFPASMEHRVSGPPVPWEGRLDGEETAWQRVDRYYEERIKPRAEEIAQQLTAHLPAEMRDAGVHFAWRSEADGKEQR